MVAIKVARSLISREEIWPNRLLECGGLARFSSERNFPCLQSNIERLWQVGLLRADLVRGEKKIELAGLVDLHTEAGQFWYADTRRWEPTETGFPLTAAVEPLPDGCVPFFHPFRHHVVADLYSKFHFRINWRFLYNQENPSLAGEDSRTIAVLSDRLRSKGFANRLESLSETVALAVLPEPLILPVILGRYQQPAYLDPAEFRRLLQAHADETFELYRAVGEDRIRELHRDLCEQIFSLEPNSDVLRLLRLAKTSFREKLKGRLAAAMLFFQMAEIIRRCAEEAFGQEIPEEDDVGQGGWPNTFKKRFFGSHRLLDRDPRPTKQFLRSLGLEEAIRVRVYVEGSTEYGFFKAAILHRLINYVDFVDLRGVVVQKRQLAFLDSLQSDLDHEVFSLICLDGDVADSIRALKKAAAGDRFFGRVFVMQPDFELANFSLTELTEIIVQMAQAAAAPEHEIKQLRQSLPACQNTEQLHKVARTICAALDSLGKDASWGRKLKDYADKHPKKVDGKTRPAVEAAREIIRFAKGYEYRHSREEQRVDPETLSIVDRKIKV